MTADHVPPPDEGGIGLAELRALGATQTRLQQCSLSTLPAELVTAVADLLVHTLSVVALEVRLPIAEYAPGEAADDDVVHSLEHDPLVVHNSLHTPVHNSVHSRGDGPRAVVVATAGLPLATARRQVGSFLPDALRCAGTGRAVRTESTRRPLGRSPSTLTIPVVAFSEHALVLQVRLDATLELSAARQLMVEQLCDTVGLRLRSSFGPTPERLLDVLSESLDDALLITHGPDGAVIHANAAASRLLHEAPQSLLGLPARATRWTWRDAAGNVLAQTPVQAAHTTGRARRNQIAHVTPQGLDPDSPEGALATRTLQLTLTAVPDPHHPAASTFVTRVRDITATRQLEATRREQIQRLAAMELVTGLAWWTYEPATQTTVWSPEMYRIAGIDPNGPRIDRDDFVRLTHPDDLWMFADPEAGDAPDTGTMAYRVVRRDGSVRHLKGWYRRHHAADGSLRIVGASIDDTDREQALLAMAERRYQFERAFDGTPYGTLLVSLAPRDRGAVMRTNRALLDVLGPHATNRATVEELLNVGQDDDSPRLDLATLLELAHTGERAVHRLQRTDGSIAWTWITAIAVEDVEADDPFLLVHVVDITSQRVQQEALEVLVRTDMLTGLANRTAMNDRIDALCAAGSDVAVLMLDLDRFKSINDGHGHHVGDELLLTLAQRLAALVPAEALIARLGGDEFVIVLGDTPDDDVDRLARRIVDELSHPLDLPSRRRVVSGTSLGVATSKGGQHDRTELLRDADLAMYRAKGDGGGRVAWCDESLRVDSERRLDVEDRLRLAIEDGELLVYRQPIINLATFGLAGHEALVRMRNSQGGLILPGEFIQLAEQTGLVADIDHWVLGQALTHIAQDRRYRANPNLWVAVNFSAHSLQRDDLLARVRRNVERHGASMHRIVMEITESSLLAERGSWVQAIEELRADGMSLAIDDFGTGYSGFSYLHTVAPDRLKIDRSFVADLDSGEESVVSTVAAIITMAHSHGIRVVAEGVERSSQADQLRRLGCDYAQGFLYGAAQPWGLPR